MSVKAAIGFDHFTRNVATWTTFADHGMVTTADTMVDSLGWVKNVNANSAAARIGIPLSSYLAAPVGKVWCGIRVRTDAAIASNGTRVFVGITTGVVSASLLTLFQASDWRTVVGPIALSSGTIGYFEFSIDIATGIIQRRFNGTPLTDISTNSTNARTWLFAGVAKVSGDTAYASFRDIYVNDDQGEVTGFLGAQIVKRVQFDVVTGEGWTTSPTAGVDLVYGLDPLDTTKDISGVAKAPLIASMKPDLPAGVSVTAIEIVAGLASTISTPVVCGMKLKTGDVELPGLNVTGSGSNVVNYNNSGGVFALSPSGKPWTNALLDSTDVVLTPDI